MSQTKPENKAFWKKSNPLAWGVGITFVVAIFILVLGLTKHCAIDADSTQICTSNFKKFWLSSPNEIGDTLAGIAGALAFLWIIVTVILQSQELREQRLEFEQMNSTMAAQLFENKFVSLITTYNEILSSMNLIRPGKGSNSRRSESVVITGRDCFNVFYNKRLKAIYNTYKENEDALNHSYMLFWETNRSELGHYFRFLYRAFLIIDKRSTDKLHHGRILRSLLSDHELLLIYYNCLTEQGKNFQELALKFELFDNLPKDLLLSSDHTKLIPIIQKIHTEPSTTKETSS